MYVNAIMIPVQTVTGIGREEGKWGREMEGGIQYDIFDTL
jgi:hypothetical protein